MKRWKAILLTLTMCLIVPIFGSGTSEAAVTLNSTCSQPSNPLMFWSNKEGYSVNVKSSIASAPVWCINGSGRRLVFQNNGDLCVWSTERSGGGPLWCTHTDTGRTLSITNQTDGNLVIRDSHGVAEWASRTDYRAPGVFDINLSSRKWIIQIQGTTPGAPPIFTGFTANF